MNNRIKSLVWRLGAMIAAAGVAWVISPEVVTGLGLPPMVVALGGLVIGEITKYLNTTK